MTEIKELSPTLKLGLLRLDAFSVEKEIHSRREAEKQGAIYLLNKLFPNEDVRLMYHSNGRPYAENTNTGISISHSHHLLGILVDRQNIHTGLDVELFRDKVLKIRHKFLSESERAFIPDTDIYMNLAAWCIKETMYKIHADKLIDFKEHIIIEKFNQEESLVKANCRKNEINFSKIINISKLDEYLLAWPIN